MSRYQHKSRNNTGKVITGFIESLTEESAASELVSDGLIPITIQEVAETKQLNFDWRELLVAKQVDLEELIVFSRQMYSLSKAGIPIVRALNGLADSTVNKSLEATIREVLKDLESGQPLAQAMSQHKRVFDDLYISIVHVGENSGRLDEAFKQLGGYLELERETRKRVKSATRYPTFVIIAMAIGLTIINIFVIPAFSGVFEKLGAELPWQTKVLIGFSNFMLNYWPLLLAGLIAGFLAMKAWLKTEDGRYKWDKFKISLPILGSLFERIHLGRFCRSFSMMMKSGVPLVQGLNVVSFALGNAFMAQQIREMRTSIERGEGFLQASAGTGLFTPLVLQMISVGEETGGIDEMLAEAADFYEQEVDYELKGLADAIEPILIIGIGMMILVLALGVFLPLWDLSSAAH